MPEQQKDLLAHIENWKQSTPQLDDMLVVGVKV